MSSEGDIYTLPLSLDLNFKGGRVTSVLVSLEGVVKTVSLQTTGTDQEFGRWDENNGFLNIFLQYCNKPLCLQQERIRILC